MNCINTITVNQVFFCDYLRITFEERIEEYKKIHSMENTELNY